MLPKKNPILTDSWKDLEAHYHQMMETRIIDLFELDPQRFNRFSFRHEEILVDISKNIISDKTLELLLALANEIELKKAIDAMFSGEIINETENRAVLHTALRAEESANIEVDGKNVMVEVNSVLRKIESFSSRIISGEWKGYNGKAINNIVNIGIGGSDLGPAMVCEALSHYRIPSIQTHFVSNIDGAHLAEVLKKLNPENTLFIISSKTFTTQETMTNAFSAREWFLEFASEKEIAKHFVAVSANERAVRDFGINPDNMFSFWDWVGGRYSVWSAIGLPIACSIGYKNFLSFLAGARSIDVHFRETVFEKNIPVLLALTGVWYTNFFKSETEAILPYNQYLNRLVDYLQQVTMESNGKRVDRNGKKVNYSTCPVIWGGTGTNSQHSFFQLIHQGTRLIPCDFIAFAKSLNPMGDHHDKLISNFLGQTNALMTGRTEGEVKEEMRSQGKSEGEIKKLLPFRTFAGNKPTNTILLKELTPYNLGSLIAVYEHKVFVQGIIWNIFSFDQWGVELGKQIAGQVLKVLKSKQVKGFDPSTRGLITTYRKMNNTND